MLRLFLETSPTPQARAEFRLADGQVVIGRGDDCDWRIDDPQMYVSRRHCVVAGQGGQYRVTDLSRGGLFIDGAPAPLGEGVTAVLVPGMRLRLGDFVIRAEMESAAAAAPAPAARGGMFGDDFFTPRPEAPPPPRPASLPDPFDAPRAGAAGPSPARDDRPAPPPFFDDPFTMDHEPRARVVQRDPPPPAPPRADPRPEARPEPKAEPKAGGDFGSAFDLSFGKPPQVEEAPQAVADFDFGDFGLPADLPPPKPADPPPVRRAVRHEAPLVLGDAPPPPVPEAAPTPATPAPSLPDAGAFAALMRGMGIDPPEGFTGTPQEIEALGRRFRKMTEGLVQLLRMRAREKGSARVAQTVIGAANVNPLKFLVTAEDAVAALVAPKGPGYLDPDAAIAAALNDLSDHHTRSWSGMQAALRRMIDRFDPALFEAEVEDVGLLKAMVAGSRSARLWETYGERYREMAKAAEDRFLGEVGADFREAYENEPRRTDNGTA